MKKIMSLCMLFLGVLLMSSAPLEDYELPNKYPLIQGECDNGYQYEYYDVGYSQEDHEDIVSSICNDPNNVPEITPAEP